VLKSRQRQTHEYPDRASLTIAHLDAMPDDGQRYEIIGGELFVSCPPGLTHQMSQ
jgi:hypothetical protein